MKYVLAFLVASLALFGLYRYSHPSAKQINRAPLSSSDLSIESTKEDTLIPISLGLLYTCDSFLVKYAVEQGFFEKAGLKGELTFFQSAAERDAAYMSGTIGGIATDYCAVAISSKTTTPLVAVALTIGSDLQSGKVGLLSAPASGIHTMEQTKGHSIGISKHTMVEYIAQQLFIDAGIHLDEVQLVQLNKIHIRLNMLLSNQIALVILPEPMLSFAIASGAHLVRDTSYGIYCHATLAINQNLSSTYPELPGKLREALKNAAKELNQNSSVHKQEMIAYARIPQETSQTFIVPLFPEENLPDPAYFQRVLKWCIANQYLTAEFENYQGIL